MSDLLRRTLGEGVRLETRLGTDPWFIHADANQLENAIINLAVNARDAMPDGGQLTIETSNVDLDERVPRQSRGHRRRPCDVGSDRHRHRHVAGNRVQAFEPFFTTKGPGKEPALA